MTDRSKSLPIALGIAWLAGTATANAQAPEPEATDPAPAAAPATAETPANEPVAPVRSAEKAAPSAAAPSALVPPPAAPNAASSDESGWFSRAPLAISVGEGNARWALSFYGFIEADYITDSTRSYGDSIGSALVARSDTYDGQVGRTQFSMRNTRLGLSFESPSVDGIKPSAVLEGDFFGNQPSVATSSETAVYGSPGFRVRHAYLSLQSDYVDVIAGQTYNVFGWQNYFFPCSAEFLGLPNMVFSRSTQFRLAHAFGKSGPVSVELAVSAARPAQRDSGVPDANAGLRFSVESWKGITTPGNTGTLALPLSVGVSGVARQFRVNAFTPPPAQRSNSAMGWGLSIDALIPVIPAANGNDRGNRLTLTGSFVTGTGIADLITTGGGATFPTLPNPAQANPPPLYDANIDNGLVSFDTRGVLHTLDWQAMRAGLQYYLPPSGRVIFAANYTYAHSKNLGKLFPQGGAEIELLGRVANASHYADVNLFWDATKAVRFGVSGQYTKVDYLDGDHPHNLRGMGQALYVF